MSLDISQRFARLSTTRQTITSGSATTLTNAKGPILVLVNPASLLSAHAITFPSAPFDGQRVRLIFGGTITAGNVVVTSCTVVANAGQSVLEPAAPGSKSAGTTLEYVYVASLTKWYRLV
ncbi:hypothetical protein [Spirosoma sp. 48-14]|uniref:hypothetical protein n=1 Tax=Spirosoma sp. 48-14 TaxID=1895854 RepID=UPI0009694EF4|nr:hypothetical protein [Spirosoma sp. 48-14]OJW75697.1 MAG: hypothetical protein BGO59_09020 [Spirosoma sp. 48-14]